jgi:hypothetical protein
MKTLTRTVLTVMFAPWAIKDPRFCETIRQWLPLLADYAPTLLSLTKPIEEVRESYERRNQSPQVADRRTRLCAKIYARWPWQRHQVDYHAIESVAALFDFTRHGHEGHGVAEG